VAAVSEVGIDEMSCFRQLFLLHLRSMRAWAQTGFLKRRRFSRLSSSVGGGRSLLKGEHALFYLIQRLVCLCKRDKPRRHKVCYCWDTESESCGQVSGAFVSFIMLARPDLASYTMFAVIVGSGSM
jgi:hypothetical protein